MAKFWNSGRGVLGIMSAMHEEIHSLIDSMEVASKTEIGGRVYYTGVLFGQSVVCVFSHWGKVASSVTAVELIRHFEVKHIVFTGVAGSIVNEVKIGDIVLFGKWSGTEVKIDGKEYSIMKEADIMGISKGKK